MAEEAQVEKRASHRYWPKNWAARIGLGLLAVVAAYFLTAWIGSSIPRNANWSEPDDGITILVETNGVHTGIVMPIVSEVIDWRTVFPSAGEPTRSGELPTHIAVGWGERDVFLNVATWGDLDPLTALRVVTVGGDTLLRVSHYVRPAPSPDHRPLRLRPWEYERLVRGIEASMPRAALPSLRRSYTSYQVGDVHYDALGRYNPITTCNSWVGNRLAEAGVKTGWWTPFSGSVMKWVPEPEARAVH